MLVTKKDCLLSVVHVGPPASQLGRFGGTMGMYCRTFCSSTNMDQRVGCYSRAGGTWQRKPGVWHRELVGNDKPCDL